MVEAVTRVVHSLRTVVATPATTTRNRLQRASSTAERWSHKPVRMGSNPMPAIINRCVIRLSGAHLLRFSLNIRSGKHLHTRYGSLIL